ncbi:MAG TPA: LLM class F420-dependent oxidoreductase [Myxococcota bacterium]|nr:LLM class F420-dependent oxidoreductase [Myxococcota bacterium]
MKLGAIFPTTEIGTDPAAVRDWAQAAEALGYSHMIVYDHVLGAVHAGREPKLLGPYTERDAFHEPFVLLAYLAAITEHLELTTGVLILPQRQTALVAKQAVELDLLSRGRLRLGVGTGWNHVEYESLGVPYADRGARLDEQVELLRRLWGASVLDFRGHFHRIDRAGLLPLPARRIPIWFGGFTPVALRRASRTGDGFLFGTAPSRMLGLLANLREQLEKEGRASADFGTEAVVDFSAPRDSWGAEIERWRAAGGTHVSLRAMDTASEQVGAKRVGFRGPRDYIDALETFRREVA